MPPALRSFATTARLSDSALAAVLAPGEPVGSVLAMSRVAAVRNFQLLDASGRNGDQVFARVRGEVDSALRLAEQLGAETITLTGRRMSEAILEFARARNVTKIVVGKPDMATPLLSETMKYLTINPTWNALLRTTCIVTQIDGGHAPNALPQHVTANVNCRILPDVPVADVQKQIETVLADASIKVTPKGEGGVQSPEPPLSDAIVLPARKVAETIWPGVAVVPMMSTGYSDGKYLNPAGVPTYGLSGMFEDAEGNHIHGLNERMRVQSLMDGRRFLYEVVKLYADGGD